MGYNENNMYEKTFKDKLDERGRQLKLIRMRGLLNKTYMENEFTYIKDADFIECQTTFEDKDCDVWEQRIRLFAFDLYFFVEFLRWPLCGGMAKKIKFKTGSEDLIEKLVIRGTEPFEILSLWLKGLDGINFDKR